MLDVHPPHSPTHTWKDFFIHIATIVVGLLIAVGLEQTVEYFHHLHQRHQLLEDLRDEAEARVRLIHSNNKAHLATTAWSRGCLNAALLAQPSGGYVTFVLPPEPEAEGDEKPETAVWSAAKASGVVNVLNRPEVEAWERVDDFAQRAETDSAITRRAYLVYLATSDHLGVTPAPGTTLHLNLTQRDEFTRDLALLIESADALFVDDTLSAAATEAALHGAFTNDQMRPYIAAEFKYAPRKPLAKALH